ncbi:hypothetical protein B5S31_g2611 [[Candida] boidinii]|nr:hypothetical protein B5S31_g2611 [[Candida] boidinii]GME73301.1 unnamed protein product [[Candida] boidinii]
MSSILGLKTVHLATARATKLQAKNTFTKCFSSCSQRYTFQNKPEAPLSGTTAEKKSKEETFNPHANLYRNLMYPFLKINLVSFGAYYGLQYLWECLHDADADETSDATLVSSDIVVASEPK